LDVAAKLAFRKSADRFFEERAEEAAVRDAVQEPLVFQCDMPDEAQSGLGLRVRRVVEMAVGNRLDDAQGGLHLAFEIGDEKIGYSFRLFGIHECSSK
jgi:hypothetical protein